MCNYRYRSGQHGSRIAAILQVIALGDCTSKDELERSGWCNVIVYGRCSDRSCTSVASRHPEPPPSEVMRSTGHDPRVATGVRSRYLTRTCINCSTYIKFSLVRAGEAASSNHSCSPPKPDGIDGAGGEGPPSRAMRLSLGNLYVTGGEKLIVLAAARLHMLGWPGM
ncbi:hypothetical protein FKP32DRAFT_576704 [Trametes sanguinea]|nr:hypothetical protein FKP32DRAFT_576704 [Trametes sanguinea]